MIPLLIVAAVIVAPPLVLGWSLCRAAARGDYDPADIDDVFCPTCDGTDLDDWGEPGWWACRDCKMLFNFKEPT